MPLPPILEIYVVWHPADDRLGSRVATAVAEHFHGTAFAGLAGGAVEVYVRREGWEREGGPPRPLPPIAPLPHQLPRAEFTAVVPVLGNGLARAVQDDPDWRSYLDEIAGANGRRGLSIYPLHDPAANLAGTELMSLLGAVQGLNEASTTDDVVLCRELSQAIAQNLAGRTGEDARITVFISHTKHQTLLERDQDGPRLYEAVRQEIAKTHLQDFFDAQDLQPGTEWEQQLDAHAGRSALLMARTDRYASREWTQREVESAKRHDIPVVALQALSDGEERGSFLMDHVPTFPCSLAEPQEGIRRALNRIVDEFLKRVLWLQQSTYLAQDGFDWLPVHAPEPVTVTPWLLQHRRTHPSDQHIHMIHPDPALGPREHAGVVELCRLAGFMGTVDVLTPRTFAARGGRLGS